MVQTHSQQLTRQGKKKIFPLLPDTRMTTQNIVYVSSPPLAPSNVVMNEMPKPNAPQLITSVQQIPPQLSIDGTNYPHQTTQHTTIYNLQPNKTLVFNNPKNERHEQQAYFQTSAAVNDPNYQHIQKPADKWLISLLFGKTQQHLQLKEFILSQQTLTQMEIIN